jgi:hypothetical protein
MPHEADKRSNSAHSLGDGEDSFKVWWSKLQARAAATLAESEPDPDVFPISQLPLRPLSE